MELAGISTIICIKPSEEGLSETSVDVVISKSIKETGAYEEHIVNNVIWAMNRFPEATFLG